MGALARSNAITAARTGRASCAERFAAVCRALRIADAQAVDRCAVIRFTVMIFCSPRFVVWTQPMCFTLNSVQRPADTICFTKADEKQGVLGAATDSRESGSLAGVCVG